jgi:hypothetical protein
MVDFASAIALWQQHTEQTLTRVLGFKDYLPVVAGNIAGR